MAMVGEETFFWTGNSRRNLFLSWKPLRAGLIFGLGRTCSRILSPGLSLLIPLHAPAVIGSFSTGGMCSSVCNSLENVASKQILKTALNHSHWKIIRACSYISVWLGVESNLRPHSRKNLCTCLLLLPKNQKLFFKQVWRKRKSYLMCQINFSTVQNGKYIKTISECVHLIHLCLKYCLSQVQLIKNCALLNVF